MSILARLFGSIALVAFASASSVHAQTVVPFDAIVVPLCILTVSSPGILTMSTTGTELISDQTTGKSALLTVVATGGTPTLLFTAQR